MVGGNYWTDYCVFYYDTICKNKRNKFILKIIQLISLQIISLILIINIIYN